MKLADLAKQLKAAAGEQRQLQAKLEDVQEKLSEADAERAELEARCWRRPSLACMQ